jgi:DNA-binding MarR family transcriptional regulator
MNDNHDMPCNSVRLIENLLRLGRQTIMHLDDSLEDVGLSGAKMWALKHLLESNEPLGVTALADCIGSGKSNATQLIDRLEQEGLVRRVPHAEDRRATLVEVTDEGKRRYQAGVEVRERVSHMVLETLNNEERQELERLVDKLLASS